LSANRDVVTFGFSGKNLDKKDFLGKSDPFMVISRCHQLPDLATIMGSGCVGS
jgi:hypothetical protein